MKEDLIYKDNLIEIGDDSIKLKHYYLPFISKKILFTNIEEIETKELPFMGWQFYGIGVIEGFITWLPFDPFRPTRDRIFIITIKDQRIRSGFTVENSDEVENLLVEKDWLLKIFS